MFHHCCSLKLSTSLTSPTKEVQCRKVHRTFSETSQTNPPLHPHGPNHPYHRNKAPRTSRAHYMPASSSATPATQSISQPPFTPSSPSAHPPTKTSPLHQARPKTPYPRTLQFSRNLHFLQYQQSQPYHLQKYRNPTGQDHRGRTASAWILLWTMVLYDVMSWMRTLMLSFILMFRRWK